MTEKFIVRRAGWNAANQSSRSHPHDVDVCEVEAETPEAAVNAACQRGVTCYNGQSLYAVPLSEVVAERHQTMDAIAEWEGSAPEGCVVRHGTYRPNGGMATWQYETLATVEIAGEEWEQAQLKGGELGLFQHDGPVLHYESFAWVPAAEVSNELIECFTGPDARLGYDDLGNLIAWLRNECGLEDDSSAFRTILATALRQVADDLTE